jgi:hypothetical protein
VTTDDDAGEVGDEDLLLGVAEAVGQLHERFAAVEQVLSGSTEPGRRRRRRAVGIDGQAAMRRRLRPHRRDPVGTTWTVWAFDRLALAEQIRAMHLLHAWVDWLNAAYELPLTTWAVTPCWYEHPGVVRELWALMGAYEAAHTTAPSRLEPPSRSDAEKASDASAYWHERLLWPCLKRLRDEHGLRECADTKHTVRVMQSICTDDGFAGAIEKLAAGWTL